MWEMNEQTKWYWAHDFLVSTIRKGFPDYGPIEKDEAQAIIDFIIELVHEIERLQTESIELNDKYNDLYDTARRYQREILAELMKVTNVRSN